MVIFHCGPLKITRYGRIIHLWDNDVDFSQSQAQKYQFFLSMYKGHAARLRSQRSQRSVSGSRRSTDAEHRGLWLGHRTLHPALERGRQGSLRGVMVFIWCLYGIYWDLFSSFNGIILSDLVDLTGIYVAFIGFRWLLPFDLWLFVTVCELEAMGKWWNIGPFSPFVRWFTLIYQLKTVISIAHW